MEQLGEMFGAALVLGLLVILVSMVMAFPVMWLWNWLMPDIFGLVTISLWQAWGLSMLSGLLFKSTSITRKE